MISFLLTQLSIALFGLPVVFHPALRREPLPLRALAAFIAGSVILTLESLLLSYAGMSWGERTLPVPIVVATLFAVWKWRRRVVATSEEVVPNSPQQPIVTRRRPPVVAVAVILIASAWLVHSTHVTRAAVSPENVAIVGAKAARLAESRNVMLPWRGLETTAALRPADPPLPEISRAWSDIVLNRETWKDAAAASTLWFLLTMFAVAFLLRPMIGEAHSWIVAAFWSIAMALAVVDAKAVGGAEVLFVAFTTIAAIATQRADERAMRTLAAWSLAAMALTRPEGVVFAVALAVAGTAGRLVLTAISVAAAASWYLPATMAGVMLPFRPEFLFDGPAMFYAGSYGLAFALPLAVIATLRPRALTFVALLVGVTIPAVAAQMRLPTWAEPQPYVARAVLPLLAVLIVSAAITAFSRRKRAERGASGPRVKPGTPAPGGSGVGLHAGQRPPRRSLRLPRIKNALNFFLSGES